MAQTTRRIITLLLSLSLGAALSVASGPEKARAQAAYCTGAGCLISTSSTTTSTAATAALVYLLVRPKRGSSAHLAAYLDANRVAVQDALVLGSGPARDDLATLMFEEHDPELAAALGRALRTQRDALSSVLDVDGTIEAHHARLFEQVVHIALAEEMTAP